MGPSEPPGPCPKTAVNNSPPIYLNNATVDLENSVTANFGQQDGLEAIVFNGTVSSPTFTWKTAGTDPMQPLGYLLDGDLGMVGGTFKVPGGSVVKAKHGTLDLSYGANYGLVIRNSQVGASFFDTVSATRTPIAVVATQLACPVGACSGPSAGHDGVFADFTGSGTLGRGLLLDSNTVGGSV